MKCERKAAIALIVVGGLVLAQSPISVWDGVYSAAQAKRGESIYAKECASCHGAKLEGKGQTPALSGTEFTGNWDGMTVGDIWEKMQSSMPADKPGSLSEDQNATILAFILSVNKFPAASADLPSDLDRLRKIRFTAAKPK